MAADNPRAADAVRDLALACGGNSDAAGADFIWLPHSGRTVSITFEDGQWLIARAKNRDAVEIIKELWRVCRGVTPDTENDSPAP